MVIFNNGIGYSREHLMEVIQLFFIDWTSEFAFYWVKYDKTEWAKYKIT